MRGERVMKKILPLLLLPVVLYVAIVLTNNFIARDLETTLLRTPLPQETEIVSSDFAAGLLSGNGNGMQYCGTLLLRSHLTEEEIREHYSRSPRPNTILIVRPVSDSEMPPFAYCLELWHGGFVSGWDPLLNLDFRGH